MRLVSKHWNPAPKTLGTRPSRIRRDPLFVPAPPAPEKKSEWKSIEWERRFAIAGIVAFAFAIAVVALAFSAVTAHFDVSGASPAELQRFGSCKNEGGPNCVLNGDTIRVAGEQMEIAGMIAPRVEAASCGAEEQRGAKAVNQLLQLLKGGKVTLGQKVREPDGTVRRTVLVNGRDLATPMIASGAAREYTGEKQDWCAD